jgi:preprotein translocase subunit SecG
MQNVLAWVVGILHVIVSLVMVALILLHSGRGGGLSDVFGGGMMASNLGGSTLAERNLNRLTVIAGIVFGITTIALSFLLTG